MINTFPIWLIAIDYIFAILMLILVLKFILNLFFNEGSNLVFFSFISKITLPILNISKRITPSFIVQPIIPLYIGWLLFMIRIYFLPLFLGFDYIGKFAFIFEKKLFSQIKSIMLDVALNLNYGI
tara:strand:+ start:126 stop:500 length:375 start_codon:yes stop_codon:yes gene_type:complete